MAEKLLSITVKGKEHIWAFNFYADPKYLKEWQEDGLDIVQIENIVPNWATKLDLVKEYCFLQDLWNFKNPFKSKAGKVNVDK